MTKCISCNVELENVSDTINNRYFDIAKKAAEEHEARHEVYGTPQPANYNMSFIYNINVKEYERRDYGAYECPQCGILYWIRKKND